jgi:predicted methyltransferase MtxX (methanogen marker protein 4)
MRESDRYSFPTVEAPEVCVGVGICGKGSNLLTLLEEAGGTRAFRGAAGLLAALREGEIQAAVRGELEAGDFLRQVMMVWGRKKLFRIALLSTARGRPFLFAPIGVDEGDTLEEKVRFVRYGRSLLGELGWPDRVGILSGGRMEDLGRSARVERSLRQAEALAARTGARLRHILIEEAVAEDTFVLAPDGRSGNLIYRTLVHLGNGRSHGAVYYPGGQVIVDTSRAAPPDEYREAVKLARFLAAKRDDSGPARL